MNVHIPLLVSSHSLHRLCPIPFQFLSKDCYPVYFVGFSIFLPSSPLFLFQFRLILFPVSSKKKDSTHTSVSSFLGSSQSIYNFFNNSFEVTYCISVFFHKFLLIHSTVGSFTVYFINSLPVPLYSNRSFFQKFHSDSMILFLVLSLLQRFVLKLLLSCSSNNVF